MRLIKSAVELPTGVAVHLAPRSSPSRLTNSKINTTKTKNTPKKSSSNNSAYGQASCSTTSRQESLSVNLSKVVCRGGYSDSTGEDMATSRIGLDDVNKEIPSKSVIEADLGPHL